MARNFNWFSMPPMNRPCSMDRPNDKPLIEGWGRGAIERVNAQDKAGDNPTSFRMLSALLNERVE